MDVGEGSHLPISESSMRSNGRLPIHRQAKSGRRKASTARLAHSLREYLTDTPRPLGPMSIADAQRLKG